MAREISWLKEGEARTDGRNLACCILLGLEKLSADTRLVVCGVLAVTRLRKEGSVRLKYGSRGPRLSGLRSSACPD